MSRIIKSSWIANRSIENRKIELKSIESSVPLVEEHTDLPDAHAVIAEREAIIQKAQEEAASIIQLSQREAERVQQEISQQQEQWLNVERRLLEEEAKQIGYEEGYSVGKQQGFEDMQELIRLAQNVVSSSKVDYQHYLDSAESTILELAVSVAEKIIHHQIQSAEETYLQLVKKAIKDAREFEHVELRVHPFQYEKVLVQKDELQGIFPKETNFFIFPDEELSETDCIIETTSGRIDASVDSQLKEMKHKLHELLEGE